MRRDGDAEPGIGTAETVTLPDAEPALERPVVEALAKGTMVDRFVVLELLGEGGMGVVYSAYDGQLDRKVALKFLRREVGDEERLVREAQAMARLSHQHVVQVFEVGSFHGRVFVAMEYVPGTTLKGWLRAKPRTWAELWPVLRGAARGLAAAHAAGMVHRDFKPDNVLVDGEDRPRVTDFGLARSAEGQRGGDADEYSPLDEPLTRTGAVVGTPSYMAPEQHLGEKTDASSDQFSFCVTLYEAIYGERPFAGDTLPVLADAVISGRVEPPPRGSQVPRWRREILLRGLARDPAARFPSMDALVAALDRDPAAARRRRLVLGAGAAVIAAAVAVVAVVVSRGGSNADPVAAPAIACQRGADRLAGTWDPARRTAVAAALRATGHPAAGETAERFTARIDKYASAWSSTYEEACAATHVRGEQSADALDLRMECLERRRSELAVLVDAFLSGLKAAAIDGAVLAAEKLEPVSSCDDVANLRNIVPLPADPAMRARVAELFERFRRVDALFDAGRYEDGEREAKGVKALAEGITYAPLLAQFALWRGLHAWQGGNLEAAEKNLQEAIKLAARGGDLHAESTAWLALAVVVGQGDGRFEEAMLIARSADAVIERLGNPDRIRWTYANNLGAIHQAAGKLAEARKYEIEALRIGERVGPDTARFGTALSNYGASLTQLGELGAGLKYLQRGLEVRERTLGPNHPDLAYSHNSLALNFHARGRYAEGLRHVDQALALVRASYGDEHMFTAYVMQQKCDLLAPQGRAAEAIALCERSLELQRTKGNPDHLFVGAAIISLGEAHRHAGDSARAARFLKEAVDFYVRTQGADAYVTGNAELCLGSMVEERGDHARALQLCRHAEKVAAAQPEPPKWDVAHAAACIGDALLGLGRPAEAVPHCEKALSMMPASDTAPADRAGVAFALARAIHSRDPARAFALATESAALLADAEGNHDRDRERIRTWLAKQPQKLER